jgi:predicted ATPase
LIEDAAHVVSEVLRSCPKVQILATSRQAFCLDGERVYRVPPLGVPARGADTVLSIGDALHFSAVRLFVERAEALDSRFALTESMIPAVVYICRRLDGIALAIELAAAHSNVFSATTIAQRLDEHFLAMTGAAHAALSRHKTMRAAFDWSYNLLNERERSVFRRLSVFVNGYSLELATALWTGETEKNEIVDVLASLVDKSLIQCDILAEPLRYEMLEPARQYAHERLREHDEHGAASRAHARALLALADDFDSRFEIIPSVVWDGYIEREYENFRSAIEWALGPEGDKGLAQRLAGARCVTWSGYGSGQQRKWIRSALETCDETTSPEIRAKLELEAACAAAAFELDVNAMLTACQRAVDCQIAGDSRAVASAQYFLGHALRVAGRIDEADSTLRAARTAAHSCGVQSEYARVTQILATVRVSAGDLDEARALLSEVLQLDRAARSDQHAASTASTLAEVEFASGDVEKAIQLSNEAAEVFRAHRDLPGLALALSNSSAYFISKDRFEEARRRAREAVQCAHAVGRNLTLGWALQHLAAVAVFSNDRNRDGDVRAANIIGYVDGMSGETVFQRDPTEQQEYEKLLRALHEVFEEHELAKLMAAGRAWPEERAVAEAFVL